MSSMFQTVTPWSSCPCAAQSSSPSHFLPAHSWTTELCTGDTLRSDNCPVISLISRELFEYYNAGGLETSEELELAILLRDQEALNSQVGTGDRSKEPGAVLPLTDVHMSSWGILSHRLRV